MSNIQSKLLVALTVVTACFAWTTQAAAQDSNLIRRGISYTQTGGPLFEALGNNYAAAIQGIGSSYADQVRVAYGNGNQATVDALVGEFQINAAAMTRQGLLEGMDNISEMTDKMDALIAAASSEDTVVQLTLYRGILISAHDNARLQIRAAFNAARNSVANAANGN